METFVTHPEFQKLNIGFSLDEGIFTIFFMHFEWAYLLFLKKKDMSLDEIKLSPQNGSYEKHLDRKRSILNNYYAINRITF